MKVSLLGTSVDASISPKMGDEIYAKPPPNSDLLCGTSQIHGGRRLHDAPGSLDPLPAIARAVKRKGLLFLDHCMRRVAGGEGVGAGRNCVLCWPTAALGVSAAGFDRVAQMLDVFRSEIGRAGALGDLRNLDEIVPALLIRLSNACPPPARPFSALLATASKVSA